MDANPLIRRPHTISREKFISVLRQLGSPAAAEAEALADIPTRYGIDRGIALAFFVHESSAGKAGIALRYQTRNWGNLRRVQRPGRGFNIDTTDGQFAKYRSWAAGLEDWCELLLETYEWRWGLTRLGDILMKYAPRSDNNNPEGYARKVLQHIERWRREEGSGPQAATYNVRVTATAGLNIRRGPGTHFERVGALPFGTVIAVSEAEPSWLKLADGRGYLHSGFVVRE